MILWSLKDGWESVLDWVLSESRGNLAVGHEQFLPRKLDEQRPDVQLEKKQ